MVLWGSTKFKQKRIETQRELLAIDRSGKLVIVELKRDKTPPRGRGTGPSLRCVA